MICLDDLRKLVENYNDYVGHKSKTKRKDQQLLETIYECYKRKRADYSGDILAKPLQISREKLIWDIWENELKGRAKVDSKIRSFETTKSKINKHLRELDDQGENPYHITINTDNSKGYGEQNNYLIASTQLESVEKASPTNKNIKAENKVQETKMTDKDESFMSIPVNNELIKIPKDNEGYFFPSTLIVSKQGEIDSNGNYQISSLRVSTVQFLINGDVTVRTNRRSLRLIQNTKSISDPIKTVSYGDGTSKGESLTPFYGVKAGQEEIIVLEATHDMKLGGNCKEPFLDDNIIIRTLFKKILKTPYHDFSGTHTTAPTGRIRILISFPHEYLPKKINTIQINSKGEISENGFAIELVEEKNLWIVECRNPQYDAGIYACWVWPN